MSHVCVQRFDVTNPIIFFLKTKRGLNVKHMLPHVVVSSFGASTGPIISVNLSGKTIYVTCFSAANHLLMEPYHLRM